MPVAPILDPEITRPTEPPEIPMLENGDRLDQKTFHERYEAMPENVKAELIGGIVHMASPLKPRHGRPHARLMGWLTLYEESTPGVEALDNTTTIMSDTSEPQPDGSLTILPECGGKTRENEDEYLVGPPEFIGEIASSTESIDLHRKRDDYEREGVAEFLVAAVRQKRVFWRQLNKGKYEPLAPEADGIIRSKIFPGLWLDPAALLRLDTPALLATLRQGLASPEHAEFVKKLAAAKTPKS
jgi:Uma2 family endonuclease